MRKLSIIGIGAGHPDQLTIQAVKAFSAIDVVFMIDKGGKKMPSSKRAKRSVKDTSGTPPIESWKLGTLSATAPLRPIRAPLPHGMASARDLRGDAARGTGGRPARRFPRLGRSIALRQHLAYSRAGRGHETVAFDYEVIPGISSVQALAARHRIALNSIGGAVHITTGRKLAQGLSPELDNVVVMLDGECTFKSVTDDDVEIYWGAYSGPRMKSSSPVG